MCSKKAIKMCITFLFILLACSVSYADVQKQDKTPLILEESNLSHEEVEKLEKEIKIKPNDLSMRTKLLSHYVRAQFRSESARKARQKHITWIIQNCPEAEIAGSPQVYLNPSLDGAAYYEAKKLWLKQVENNNDNTTILENAANFFILNEPELAEDFLKRAQTLEPGDPKWSELLGELYALESHNKAGESKKETAVKSLEQLEKALTATTDETKRFYLLSDLAKAAFEAGETEKSMNYASELLNKAAKYNNDWNYGNAIHDGNLILGRIALKSMDLEKAKGFLIEAGKTPGSPQLNSFGPNMTLAKELLEKGEKETVVEYFQLCSNFWEMGKDRLDSWTSIVQKNEVPDFGGNLIY